MKNVKLTKKLVLNKSTVTSLEHFEQASVKGGGYYTEMYGGPYCHTWHPECPTKPLPNCGYLT